MEKQKNSSTEHGRSVPELRFPEYNIDWERKKLGEICEIKTGGKDTQNRVDDGLYPFFVRSNTIERINSYSYDGEAILTSGDGVGVGKNFHYINGKFDFHQRVYSLRKFDENYSGQFVFHVFSEKFYDRIKRLSAKNSVDSVRMDMISEMKISFPSLPEQQKIASFLTTVDDKLQALKKKKELLEQYKKGVMQKIFAQEIRFKITNQDGELVEPPEWEKKKLGKISEKLNNKNSDNKINFVLTNSATEGIVSQRDYFEKDIANQNNLKGYYIVERNDFVYNPRISNAAPVGPIKRNRLSKGVMSPLYMVFRFTSGNLDFFEYYFATTEWHKYMNSIANFGARFDRMNITNSEFMKMPLPWPCTEEQTKIANFLSVIDKKIAGVAELVEATEQWKKGLLQKMFV